MSNINSNLDPFQVDDFSTLLQHRQDKTATIEQLKVTPLTLERVKAERTATLVDLMDMISNIVTKATKKRNIVFEADEGARPLMDQAEPIDCPHIYYEILSRRPKNELKPRERQEVVDYDDQGNRQYGRVWGQRQVCSVQFNIVATDYRAADNAMTLFEELILSYTSFFKRNGIAEMYFQEQLTDRNWDTYRQSLSVRNLRYYVEIEQIHVAFDELEINGIISSN